MEGWVWAGIALWFHAQGRAAEQKNVLLMLSPLLIHPGGPQAVLPSHKSSSAQLRLVLFMGLVYSSSSCRLKVDFIPNNTTLCLSFPFHKIVLMPFLEVL